MYAIRSYYGGRVSATQLRYLIRALKRTEDPRPILRAFYQDAGLSLNDDALNEAPGIEDLVRGLEYLLNISAEASLASDLIALAGALDPLVITSYSIHYTKLYEQTTKRRVRAEELVFGKVFALGPVCPDDQRVAVGVAHAAQF